MAFQKITVPHATTSPPNTALPGLPALKIRNGSTAPAASRLPSASQMPSKLAVRTPFKATVSPSTIHAKSTPAVPTLRSISTNPSPQDKSADTELRRSISINSFPQPPGVSKQASIAAKTSSPITPSPKENDATTLRSADKSISIGGRSRLKRLRITEDLSTSETAASSNQSTLPTGDGEKSIPGANVSKGLDRDVTVNSPAISRSSSAEDSCSTSATTFEDVDDTRRGREDTVHASSNMTKTTNTKEAKGNVIVSVRVRPDAGGNADKKSEGEWMVDGRRSLVAYRGREGGDYFYGELVWPRCVAYAHCSAQTTFLRLMTKITKFTMLLPNDWCAV